MKDIRERVERELETLISIPSYGNNYKEILLYIEDRLKNMGIDCKRQKIEDLGSFNLICGNDTEFIISCHVDTVPPITMKEATRPRKEGNLIYGRGANDVKGQIAYTLAAVEEFIKDSKELPFSIAFVIDEENNSALGSEVLSSLLKENSKCLVLEPTSGRICTSQEGALEFRLIAKGTTAHGAESYKYFNPIKGIMDVVYHIEDKLSREVSIFKIKGGWDYYVVPDKCEILAEVKIYRGEDWRVVEEKIKSVVESYTGEIKYIREDAENFIEFKKGTLYEMLYDSIKEIRGKEPEEGVMASWTDASNYHKKGAECVVFGYGDLEVAHTEREHIRVEDLVEGTYLMLNLFKKTQSLKTSGKI